MRIIDVRSGADVVIGSVTRYPDGEWWKLLEVKPGIFRASALVEGNVIAHDLALSRGPAGESRQWVKMPVRYLHTDFPFRRVAFMPT